MNDIIKAIIERRSCKNYKPDAVPQEIIEQIIEAGLFAASGMGKQSPVILAVSDKEKRPGMSRKIGVILQGQDPDANKGLLTGIRSVFDEETTDLRIYFTNNRFSNERACRRCAICPGLNSLPPNAPAA